MFKLAFDFKRSSGVLVSAARPDSWFSTPTCNVTVDRGRHVLVSSFLSKPYYARPESCMNKRAESPFTQRINL